MIRLLGTGDVRLMFRYMQKITRSLKSIIERANENKRERKWGESMKGVPRRIEANCKASTLGTTLWVLIIVHINHLREDGLQREG